MNWLIQAWTAVALFVRGIRSPLIKTPSYRVLFFLVVVGVLLIGTLPEAAFVIPALDVIGLDIVTILVAFELRHYIALLARLMGVRLAPLLNRCLAITIAPTNPKIWSYTCMWVLIASSIVTGSMRVTPGSPQ